MHTVLILYLFYSGYLPWTFSSHFSHGFTQRHLTAGPIADDDGSAALGEESDHILAVGLKAQGEWYGTHAVALAGGSVYTQGIGGVVLITLSHRSLALLLEVLRLDSAASIQPAYSKAYPRVSAQRKQVQWPPFARNTKYTCSYNSYVLV